MFLKKVVVVIAIIVLVLNKISDSVVISSLADLANIRIVCYYAYWPAVYSGIGKFTPDNINPHLCTHLIYAFATITKDGNLKPSDEMIDIEQGGYAKFTGLKKFNEDLKTMLSLGGWNEGNIRFASIASNAKRRNLFIKNSIEFLRKYNFDGLDLDWQFPYRNDRRSYSSLIQELREGYENESKETGQPRLLLTITLPTTKHHITEGYDIPQLTKYVDWMSALTYNYHNAFEPFVNHHSQLYGVDENLDYELNANDTITTYLEAGAERHKLLLGIPTYGRGYTLSDSAITDIGSLSAGPALEGDQTEESGYLSYYEICTKIKDDGWIVKQPNPNAMGSYAYKDDQWVGYDDENIVRKKSQYVAENKLGGIMFWVLDNDDFRGYCTGKRFPLIEAAKEALITASGYTIENKQLSQPKGVRKSRRRGTTTPSLIFQYTTPEPPPTPSYGSTLSPQVLSRSFLNSNPTQVNEDEFYDIAEEVDKKDDQKNVTIDLNKIRVVCYYANWAALKVGIGRFTPENINPHLCTHIIYAFVGITKDITFKPSNEVVDIEQGGYANFTKLKQFNKDLKTLLSLGGWNEGLIRFASIASSATKRSVFIKNSIEFLRKYNFDGLDLDWQFPNLKDRLSYSTLIQELREGYESESKESRQPRLLLTITLPTLVDHIQRGYDIPKLTKHVDWMNTLTYNYSTGQEPLVSHHSQLYDADENLDYELNVNYTITYYLKSGAERDKLVLGIPTFGRAYNLNDPNNSEIGSSSNGPALKGDQTGERGFLAYHEICRKIKDNGWIVKQPYPNAMGPYAYKDNQWVGYDDENIMRKKSQYVSENQLGGVMFWLMEYDDFLGYCTGKQFPLIAAAKEALITASMYIIENSSPVQNLATSSKQTVYNEETIIVAKKGHPKDIAMSKILDTNTMALPLPVQQTTAALPPFSTEMMIAIPKIHKIAADYSNNNRRIVTKYLSNSSSSSVNVDEQDDTTAFIEKDNEENSDETDETEVIKQFLNFVNQAANGNFDVHNFSKWLNSRKKLVKIEETTTSKKTKMLHNSRQSRHQEIIAPVSPEDKQIKSGLINIVFNINIYNNGQLSSSSN